MSVERFVIVDEYFNENTRKILIRDCTGKYPVLSWWTPRENYSLLTAEALKAARENMEHALFILERGEIPHPRTGHHCAPDSNCDGDCVDWSRFCDFLAEFRKALTLLGGKP